MSQLTQASVRALVSLLRDDDPKTVRVVRRKLVETGSPTIPALREAVESDDTKLRARARSVLEAIRCRGLEQRLAEWAADDGELEAGTYILSSFADPKFDPEVTRCVLDEMAQELESRLPSRRRPGEVIEALNTYLYDELGFEGNRVNYYDPDNSYIGKVLERRKGIPITLSAVVIFLARRLGLPIQGIKMPGHFIVRYDTPSGGILLDPFNRGGILTREECTRYLLELNVLRHESALGVSSPRCTLARMLHNLKQIYAARKDEAQHRQVARFLEIVSG